MSGGGSSSAPTQTVTQTQQIPAYEQQFSAENQNLARSLGAQAYPGYGGALIAGLNGNQNTGINQAVNTAYNYQPDLGTAESLTGNGANGTTANNFMNTSGWQTGNALSNNNPLGLSAANAGQVQQFMNPYVQSSLQPQMLSAQTQLGQEQNQINAQATGAGAFGDARQGAENALQNYYGNQNMAGIEATGYDTAYNNAVSALQNQQNTMLNEQGVQLSGANQYANLANLAQQQQNLQLQAGAQYGNLANEQSALGAQAANQVYDAGLIQQQQQQNELNAAYQQYQNQVMWPYQMLNVRESALSNSPYNISNNVTLPQSNSLASGLGSFTNIAGMLGSLTTGGSKAPFGGSTFTG